MIRLIVDTALGYMGIGIAKDADLLASVLIAKPATVTTLGTKAIDFLLYTTHHDKAELGEVVVSGGPGTFTSLRAGISLAKGIGMGLDIPLVPVSTLDAMAHTMKHMDGTVVAAIDGKNNNVYLAEYGVKGGVVVRMMPDTLIKTDSVDMNAPDAYPQITRHHPVHVIGFDIERYQDALSRLYTQVHAWNKLEINRMINTLHSISDKRLYNAKPCSAVTFTPVYLRQPDINKKKKI
jgi:tRNA threonylcarbamoyl adenosine modification protein YeaZ